MDAPSARSLSTRFSYPLSIWCTFLIRLRPSAQSAAVRSAMPALISGLETSVPLSLDGPSTTTR